MSIAEDGNARPPTHSLLTIGYGGARSSEEFIELLHRHGVLFLVDVRSKPFSKFRPEFSKDALEAIVVRAGLKYIFMGDSLGGMPSDVTCYTDGKVDYAKIREREWFVRGLARLEAGWRAGHCLAIMCAELEPERCHRSKLVGEALIARGVPVGHVDADGAVVTQQAVLDRLTGGQGVLFEIPMRSSRRVVP